MMELNFTKTQNSHKTDMGLALFKRKTDWIVLVACMLLGALMAYGFSFLKKPIYEATALVTTNMHMDPQGSINEFMMDSQINLVGELYFNPKVLDKLIAKEASQGIQLDLNTLEQMATVERRMLNSLIKVRHSDPKIAAKIASDWAESLYQTLEEAYPYAVEVTTAKNTLFLLENCAGPQAIHLEKEVPIPNVDAFCESMSKDAYDQALQASKETILKNKDGSLGLGAYLNLTQFQAAAVPTRPVSFHRGSMVLAGGVLGFLLAMSFFIFRKPHD